MECCSHAKVEATCCKFGGEADEKASRAWVALELSGACNAKFRSCSIGNCSGSPRWHAEMDADEGVGGGVGGGGDGEQAEEDR